MPIHSRVYVDSVGADACLGVDTKQRSTHVFLLLIYVSDLEPYIHLAERVRRVAQNLIKTLERLGVALQLLVDDAEPKVDFVGLFKVCNGVSLES